MKAKEAPEKIYLFENPISDYPDDRWLSRRSSDDDVEYTRTDAFIENACEWLRNNSHNYADNALGKEYLVNDFKNYMKGE